MFKLVKSTLAFALVALPLVGQAANTPPALTAITNRVLHGGQTLLVATAATDADVPAQQLTFSLPTAPSGAIINTNTGVITWITTTNNAGTSNYFQVVVTDNGSPSMSATQSFTAFVRSLKPNVLIVVTDDQGYHDIGAHGAEMPTPNMDRLGSEGIRLERFYATPVCSVTRSTLLTGRNPVRTGVNNAHGLDLHEHIMPQTFKGAGYQTFMCGKWHLGGTYNNDTNTVINGVTNLVVRETAEYQPQNRGWDIHYGEYTGSINYYTHISQDNGQFDWWLNGQTNLDPGWSTDLLADKAVQLLQQRDPSKPVLLYLAFNAVHTQVSAPTNYLNQYTSIADVRRRTLVAALDQEDVALGRVLTALDTEGITTNTVVVYFSDNGGELSAGGSNTPLRGTKGDLYDGGIHTPAAIRWPGVLPAGVTNCQQFVWAGDWFPTLCAATGVAPLNSKPFDGVNMWPLLLSATNGAFNPANYRGVPLVSGSSAGSGVFDVFSNGTNVTMFKLIRDKISGNVYSNALFDIINDPYETTDLVNVAAYSNVVATLATYYSNIIAESYPPFIGVHPQSQTAVAGSNVTLWAMATVYPRTVTCQWRKNGVNIPGATNRTLVDTSVYLTRLDLTSVTTNDAASYDVVVTDNAVGWPTSTNSLPAALSVTGDSLPPDTNVSYSVSYDVLLGRPTDTSIAVSLLASNNLQTYIEYGAQVGVYTNQTATVAVTNAIPSVTTLGGLRADQQYYYRLRYRTNEVGSFAAGRPGAFHTQRARGSSYVFDIEADPHNRDNDAGVWELCLTNILADAPDFLLDLGDTFMEEKLSATNAYLLTQAGISELHKEVRNLRFGLVGHSVPTFLVDGNHEAETGWLATNYSSPAVWGALARQYYYPVPQPGGFYSGATNLDPYMLAPRDAYYAFEWGDALFISLDPFWYTAPKPGSNGWGWTLGADQYYWLKRTLENSTAKFKFVFAHHLVGGFGGAEARGGLMAAPYFEWGGYNLNGTYGFTTQRPGWPMPIQDLLLTNNVQVFFHGHDHLYVKEDLRLPGNSNGAPNLIYQDVPQPSRLPGNTNSAVGYGYTNASQLVIASSGHVRVTVSPTNALVEYVRTYLPANEGTGKTNRMISYSYSIPAPVVTSTNITCAGTVSSGSLILQWNAQPGVSYTVQRSDNLVTWSNVYAGQTGSWTDTNGVGAAPKRFYRVAR